MEAMKEAFTFDDVLIIPKFSTVASRKDVSLSVQAKRNRGFSITFPVISANMDTITGSEMAKEMARYGARACLHRFCTIEENVKTFKESNGQHNGTLVSIGLGEEELDRARALLDAGAQNFVIDVANGAQVAVAEQARILRAILGLQYGSITVGNFASAKSVEHFLNYVGWDCIDAIKVGIGPGSSCTTRVKTGVGYPQLSAIMEIDDLLRHSEIMIIADGGMRTPGDIAKAIGAGASMVMLGGMLSGTDETPGDIVLVDGHKMKKYRGSASKESYSIQNKDASWRSAEGESFYVKHKGSVSNVLQDIEGGLRSALTYTGSRNIQEFGANCEFVRITSASYAESVAHGKRN
jgi:IMP dehydrogenase